jgi:hypothetical protein
MTRHESSGQGQVRHAPQQLDRRMFLASLTAVLAPALTRVRAEVQDQPGSPRLAAMRRLVGKATVAEVGDGNDGPPLKLRGEPLLHYGDPSRGIREGTLWAWSSGGRPAAVMKIEYWSDGAGEAGHWGISLGALSPRRVSVDFEDGLRWMSRKPGLELRPIPDAAMPADSAAPRLSQAKALARRFAAHVDTHRKAGTIQLRLLPQPVDRYRDPEAGLVDGVLFGLVYSTKPIVLLGLEVRTGDAAAGAPAWHYGLARLGDGEATVRLDGTDVWTVPFIDSAHADADLYMTRPMTEGTEQG